MGVDELKRAKIDVKRQFFAFFVTFIYVVPI
jgi:hypothetical protein